MKARPSRPDQQPIRTSTAPTTSQNSNLPTLLGAAFVAIVAGFGCSGGTSPAGGTGGSGAGGNAGALTYKPCADGTRVGGFSVEFLEGGPGQPAYTQLVGGARDAVVPSDARVELAKEGLCRLIDAPTLTCTPACSPPQICAGQNRCVAEPLYQPLGTLTVTGVAPTATSVTPTSAGQYYKDTSAVSFPAAGTPVSLSAPGGAYMPFSLAGQGFPPLVFAGAGLNIARNQALAVTWTAPASAGPARIFMEVDIARHGNVKARIECDVPDTGSTTIPSALINQLMDRGTAGFPTISLIRRTIDSVTITPGCVDLVVASPVDRPLTVEGIVSCNCTAGDPVTPCGADGIPCPGAGQVCKPVGSPGGLTCGNP